MFVQNESSSFRPSLRRLVGFVDTVAVMVLAVLVYIAVLVLGGVADVLAAPFDGDIITFLLAIFDRRHASTCTNNGHSHL